MTRPGDGNTEMMIDRIQNALRWADRFFLRLLRGVAILCFILLAILIVANVFVRFVPIVSLHWFDEIIELLYAYMVFFGAAALWVTKEHFSVGDWISGRLIRNQKVIRAYRLMLESLMLVFALIFLYYSWRLTAMALDVTNAFAIPKRILYACMPISASIMAMYSLRNIVIGLFGPAAVEAEGS